MKIFISWSKDRSKAIATSLRDWLPMVLQATAPFMSSVDIDSGVRWSNEMATQLEVAQVGIFCLSPENQHDPWINFEAGAISKHLTSGKVCVYLKDLEPYDIKGPFTQFQMTKVDKDGTKRLLKSVNQTLAEKDEPHISDVNFDTAFETWWPKLEEKFAQNLQVITMIHQQETTARSQNDILNEVLELVRKQDRWIQNREENLTSQLSTLLSSLQTKYRSDKYFASWFISGYFTQQMEVYKPIERHLARLHFHRASTNTWHLTTYDKNKIFLMENIHDELSDILRALEHNKPSIKDSMLVYTLYTASDGKLISGYMSAGWQDPSLDD